MLKERARLINLSVFFLDLGLVAVAFVLAHWLRSALLPVLAPVLLLLGPSHLAGQDEVEEKDEVSPRIAQPSDLLRAETLMGEAEQYAASQDRSDWLEAARL